MKRYFSFSATREATEAAQEVPLPARKTLEVVRQSLLSLGGITYPLLQRSSMWTNPEDIDGGVLFTFDRQTPYADARFAQDLSFYATRAPTDDEAEPPIILLEALTYEFALTLWFFNRIVSAFKRGGIFRIGLGFAGFSNAQFDWSGFVEEPEVEHKQGILTNWRFLPPKDVVSYESPGVQFPTTGKGLLVKPIADIIAEVAFAVRGIRQTAFERTQGRLTLNQSNIEAVVKSILSREEIQ